MTLEDLLNSALELLLPCSAEEAERAPKAQLKLSTGEAFAVHDMERYNALLEQVFQDNPKLQNRISRQTTFKAIDEQMFANTFARQKFTAESSRALLEELSNKPSRNVRIIAPISGIRLDGTDRMTIGPFELGNVDHLSLPIANEKGYYIGVRINDSQDNTLSIARAQNAFDDFARLAHFIAGKNDGTLAIKTGLPMYPSMNHQFMYVESSSYQIMDEGSNLEGSTINNKSLEKTPIDNDFFKANPDFHELWNLYDAVHGDIKISNFKSRILNSALAIGESARTMDVRNSVIYTAIALETLFSFDEGSLFQKSIGDRLADTLAFVVGRNKEARLQTASLVKKVYGMRSALVHGGNKQIDGDHVAVKVLVRAAIRELLKNKKYSAITKINQLHEMIKDAQFSY